MALIGRVPFVLIVNGAAGEDGAGAHRLREGEQDFLRIGRAGLAASHLCRDVQGHDRHRDDARALQGQRRRHQGRGGRPRAGDVLRSRCRRCR